MFELHAAFPPTSHPVGDLPLCHVRLQDDARYPWLVLIPRLMAARELEDLSEADLARLTGEIVAAGRAVRALGAAHGFAVEKLNVASLGNVTPQLHVHVVGRRSDDPAWPGPVWGHSSADRYEAAHLAATTHTARAALGFA
jgi:diadenosine tetraphosphate (Ap4A) HIT family hydrolase